MGGSRLCHVKLQTCGISEIEIQKNCEGGGTAMSTAALTIAMMEIAIGAIVGFLFLIGKGVRDWEEVVVLLGCC